jgi:hypothetical protein
MKGFYIGATSDDVYLAPNFHCKVFGWIVALPQRDVARVRIFTSIEARPRRPYSNHHCVTKKKKWSDPGRR